MNILAIDTTTKKANVGIKSKNKNTIKSVDNEVTHSEKLLPLIDESLKEQSISLKDINKLACVTGPGSFTGIRIGLATIKALAKIINVDIYAINSLDLLAYSGIQNLSTHPKLVISVIDAKNNRGYFGIYKDMAGTLTNITSFANKYCQDILQDIESICKEYNATISDCLLIVDSISLFEKLSTTIKCKLCELDINVLLDKAAIEYSEYNYLTLDATYVRSSEAERTKYGE